MFLILEKGIRSGICHVIHQYAKIVIRIRNHLILSIGTKITCMDGQCRKNYPYIVLSGLQ